MPVVDLAEQVLTFPRHLGIHSGGMVLTDRPVGEVVPDRARPHGEPHGAAVGQGRLRLDGAGQVRPARARHARRPAVHASTWSREHLGEQWELDTIPKEEQGVYDMLCRADSIGVFQVESRAQMGTLPRLQPRRFYDLVIEIALIRPGPIQGGAVHPYIRRKLGTEEVTYLHPKLEPVLERTLGVPLFQEQLMQMAMAVGGCTGEDADLLRRAMGSKRGVEQIESLKAKLYAGMAEQRHRRASSPTTSTRKIQAFANFGFAESHSLSASRCSSTPAPGSSCTTPAAFLAALLRAQPMGFYSPQSLVADARRHGVEVLRPDILLLGRRCRARGVGARRPCGAGTGCRAGRPTAASPTTSRRCRVFDRSIPPDWAKHRRDGGFAVRLGLAEVNAIGQDLAERIVAERDGLRRLPVDGGSRPPRRPDHRTARGARRGRRVRRDSAWSGARRSGTPGMPARTRPAT